MVRDKKHGTACNIGPKGEARTHGSACAIGPKGEARTHGTACAISPKGEARTIHQCSYVTLGGSAAVGGIMLIFSDYGLEIELVIKF